MKKSRIRFHILLAALIFLVGVVPVWMSTNIISNNFKNSRAVEYREAAVRSLDQLTTYLTEQEYPASGHSDPAIHSRISTIAEEYDARILIARSDFKITESSQQDEIGRYLTMPGAIRCISEKRLQSFRITDNRYFIALPIYEKPEDGSPIQNSDALIATQPLVGVAVMIMPMDQIETIISTYSNNAEIINLFWFMIMLVAAPLGAWLLMRPYDRMYQYFVRVGKGDYSLKEQRMGYLETDELTEVLNNTVSKLSEVDKSRGEFVQNVSHELKTPLTSVKILADTLKSMDEVPIEMYREFIADISTEIDRENKIIDDLLSLVKMDKAAQSLNIEKVNVNQMLESILKRIAPIAKKDNIEVTLESRREVSADMDEMKMTLAITNIVENAIKYNYSGGWVHVTLDANHRNCIITISDSGSGIPQENIGQIFERFYRVDKARSREIGGTGLGLSITKSIIDLHAGEIQVESSSEKDVVKLEGVNQEVLENADVSVTGTVFTILLPLKYIRKQDGTPVKKKGKIRYLGSFVLLISCLGLVMGGCSVPEEKISDNPYEVVEQIQQTGDGTLLLYRPSLLLTTLVPYEVVPESDQLLPELIGLLSQDPGDQRSMAVLPPEVQVLNYQVEAGNLQISLSDSYLQMRADREILARKAIVQTMLQLPELESVSFLIGENPMAEADGTVMEPYTEESFLDK